MKRLKNLVVGILLLAAIHLIDHSFYKERPMSDNRKMSGWMWVVVVIAYFLLFLFISPKAHAQKVQSYKLVFTDTLAKGYDGWTVCDTVTHQPSVLVRKGFTLNHRIGVLAHELMHVYRSYQFGQDCKAFSDAYTQSALTRLDEEIWAEAMRIRVEVWILKAEMEKSLDYYTEKLVETNGYWEDRELLTREEIRNLLKTRQDSLPRIPNELMPLALLQKP